MDNATHRGVEIESKKNRFNIQIKEALDLLGLQQKASVLEGHWSKQHLVVLVPWLKYKWKYIYIIYYNLYNSTYWHRVIHN